MPYDTRNSIEEDGWSFTKIKHFEHLSEFDCGDDDLNQFFKEDAVAHREELLTQTYEFTDETTDLPFPIGLVSVCNDSVDRRKIKDQDFFAGLPPEKRYPAYPAVKIARLGIHKAFHEKHLGSSMVNLIKKIFTTDNRTGCRLITVDAYNEGHHERDDRVLKFYLNNDFQFFNDKDIRQETRAMFFDLKRLNI